MLTSATTPIAIKVICATHKTQIDGHADSNEKESKQQPAKGLDIGFKLMAEIGFGKHDTCEKRAHRHGEADKLHQRGGAQHDQQRRRRHDLARI
jgi:hypothetical protein